MKKIFPILSIALALTLCSCAKDSIGGTKVQNVSGEWFVNAVIVDADGNDIDYYSDAETHFHAQTFNTNANDADSLILSVKDDGVIDFSLGGGSGYYISSDIVLYVDQATKTFSIENFLMSEEYAVNATVKGCIVPGGIKTRSGAVADKIEFTIALTDSEDNTNILEYFWNKYGCGDYYEGKIAKAIKFVGWRYTGLASDEDVVSPVEY